jgi:uncharacterized radical SAM superfamily protein
MAEIPQHFNIRFTGGQISNRVGTRHIVGLDPATIEWVYVIQARRHATKKEIAKGSFEPAGRVRVELKRPFVPCARRRAPR